MAEKFTLGKFYTAERSMWHADVRFIRTDNDDSGVLGVVSSDTDAKLFAASKEMLMQLVCTAGFLTDLKGLVKAGHYDEVYRYIDHERMCIDAAIKDLRPHIQIG